MMKRHPRFSLPDIIRPPEAEELEREIHEILKEKEQAVVNADLESARKGSGQTEQRRG